MKEIGNNKREKERRKMPFIGIIAEENNENRMRRYLLEKLEWPETSVLCIKEKSIENIKNIRFETILLAREFKNVEMLKKLLEHTEYLVSNVDIKQNWNILKDLELVVITYGFNSKATITASSVEEDNVMIYLQRSMKTKKGREIEAQEIKMPKLENVNDTMGITGILCLYDKINKK